MNRRNASDEVAKPRERVRRSAVRTSSTRPPTAQEDPREFPIHPRVGVGGVVIDDGRVLLVRRGREPLKGKWSIPGGLVEVGESLAGAVRREVKEETGLEVEPLEMIGIFERILPDREGNRGRGRRSGRSGGVRYHYILIDYACRLASGGRRRQSGRGSHLPTAASDVSEARWVARQELARYRLTPQTYDLILKTFRGVGRRGTRALRYLQTLSGLSI